MPGTDTRIRAFLDELAQRWRSVALLRYGVRLGLALGAVWAVAFGVWFWAARVSLAREALLVAAVAAVTAALCGLGWLRRPRPPADAALARFVEERVPALEDRLVTAAQFLAGTVPRTGASKALDASTLVRNA